MQYSLVHSLTCLLGLIPPGFLTVGVPSIKRQNGLVYLRQTLTSLVERTSTREKTEVVVVVFLADFDYDYNNQAVTYLLEHFAEYINMGFIQVRKLARAFGSE